MKNILLMKTLAFTIMCLVYIVGLSQVSADEGNGNWNDKSQGDQTVIQNTTSDEQLAKQLLLLDIQNQWQLALQEHTQPSLRFSALQTAAKRMFKLSLSEPNNTEFKAWSGVMLSAFAGACIKGRGEHVAIFAKRMLGTAQDQQADILDTSYLANGTSARQALQVALADNPSGLDRIKYYGAFLSAQQNKLLALNQPLKVDFSVQEVIHVIH